MVLFLGALAIVKVVPLVGGQGPFQRFRSTGTFGTAGGDTRGTASGFIMQAWLKLKTQLMLQQH